MAFLEHLDVGGLAIQFAVLLFSLSIHEASHAWTADYFGDSTARQMGRVTLNPLAHIDLVGTLIFPLVQMVTGLPLIGWAKPVPVNPAHLRNPRRDQVFVSLAGPASNLLAAICALLLLIAFKLASPHAGALVTVMTETFRVPKDASLLTPVVGILFFALIINLALAFFNFIPIPPLDGHWLLYAILPHSAGRVLERVSGFGFALIYLLMIAGAFSFIFIPIRMVLALLVYV